MCYLDFGAFVGLRVDAFFVAFRVSFFFGLRIGDRLGMSVGGWHSSDWRSRRTVSRRGCRLIL